MDGFEFVAGDEVERRERQERLAHGPDGARSPAALGRRRRRPRPGSCGGDSVVIVVLGLSPARVRRPMAPDREFAPGVL